MLFNICDAKGRKNIIVAFMLAEQARGRGEEAARCF
jgi:hypothetical protein